MLIESKEATALNEVQIIVQNVKTDKLYLHNVRDLIGATSILKLPRKTSF